MKNRILRSLCVQEKSGVSSNTQPLPSDRLIRKVCLQLELYNWTKRKDSGFGCQIRR